MSIFGLASLFGALAGSPWQLITARVFMGVGGAMIMPATLAIITDIFPAEERGKAIGIWGAMNGLGAVLGPLLGGWLLEHFNWNSIFVINIPIVVTALVAGAFLIPRSSILIKRRIDLLGTALSSATVFLLVFGIIEGNDVGWAHPLVYGSFVLSAVCGVLFILHEMRTDTPMLDLSIFKNSHLSAAGGSISIMTFVMFGVLFALSLYLQFVKAYSPMQTGIRFLPVAVGYAFGSISSNTSVLRWGTKPVVAAGFLGMAILAPFIALWQVATPYWIIGICTGILSFCLGNIMTSSLNVVLGSVPKQRAGIGSAIGNISFQIGGALGVATLGSVLGSVYRSRMTAALEGDGAYPTQVIQGALESLGSAITLAGDLSDETARGLILLARESFMNGWSAIFWIICGIAIAGMCFACAFMPSRDVSFEHTGEDSDDS
jgi:EmrB/QacA subfamily drug resistance transporter